MPFDLGPGTDTHVYAVSGCVDRITRIPRKSVERRQKDEAQWGQYRTQFFETEREAAAFLLSHAQASLEHLRLQLKKAEARVKRCKARLASMPKEERHDPM